MKPDSMIVEPDYIVQTRADVVRTGTPQSFELVGRTEPALAAFIAEGLASVAGKLSLAGAPTPVVQGAHEDVLSIILTCVQALRRGHYEFWKDCLTGTRLAQLDKTFRPPTKRHRKNSHDPTE